MSEVVFYADKYAPKDLEPGNWLGNEDVRSLFHDIDPYTMPHYIFCGKGGIGKSLLGALIAKKHFPGRNYDYNMSNKRYSGVEFISTKITEHLMTGSLDGKRKLLVLTEMDRVKLDGQQALRVPFEKCFKNCVVIMTLNYLHKIMEPLQQRTTIIKFSPPTKKELSSFAVKVLDGEGITYIDSQVESICVMAKGSFRKVANTIQGWTVGKTLRIGTFVDVDDILKKDLITSIVGCNIDKSISVIEKIISEFDAMESLCRMSEIVKNYEKMPVSMKRYFMIKVTDAMLMLAQGVDEFLAMRWMVSAMIDVVLRLKKK